MKKICKALAVFTLAVSAFLIFGGWLCGLPRGTYIDGVDVSGMPRNADTSTTRGHPLSKTRSSRLVIRAGRTEYFFTYPEFNFTDCLEDTVRGIKRGGSYSSGTNVYLNGAQLLARSICNGLDRAVVEPYAVFNGTGQPFTYFEGRDGTMADCAALLGDISASLNSGFDIVHVRTCALLRKKSMDDVKRETSPLYSFTTYFDSSNAARSSNIRLACSKLNGLILAPGQIFSFNAVVGERTSANGFLPAKIISGGRFVQGVGGGVCQVSTTLYNAALLSGLEITEYHPHSLRVSYVDPSRDAMVSGSNFDLKFKNILKTSLYVRMDCSDGAVTCTLYGLSDGVKRSFISRTTAVIPQPEDIVEEGEECIVSRGTQGAVSEGYLVEERNGVRTERLIRRDRYAAAATVRRQPAAPPDF